MFDRLHIWLVKRRRAKQKLWKKFAIAEHRQSLILELKVESLEDFIIDQRKTINGMRHEIMRLKEKLIVIQPGSRPMPQRNIGQGALASQVGELKEEMNL